MAQATQQASLAAKQKKVEQGKQVQITVKLAPAPDIGGAVFVFVAPDDQPTQSVNNGSVGVGPGGTTVDAFTTIPTNAKLGTWKVVLVRFQPQNSPGTDLTITGSTTFEVIEHKTVVPTTADVQVK